MARRVAVLAFDQISPFHLSVPCLVFGEAARSAGVDEFVVQVCSEGVAAVETTAGFMIQPKFGLETLADAEIVVFPSWPSPQIKPSDCLLEAIGKAHHNGALLVGLCLGTYALASAGLLDDRDATTHWAYAQDFQQRFPQVSLQPDVLYLQRDRVVTSAGTAAAIDCCLYIVRQILGSEIANRIARLMVIAPHRSGGQAQFIELPVPDTVGDQKMAALMGEIRNDIAAPYSIDLLAQRMAMSRRTFTRHFQALTGCSVGQWLLDERLRYCQNLLESSDLSIERIAERCGFNSVVTLRHHFRRRFGVSPSEWRKAFLEK